MDERNDRIRRSVIAAPRGAHVLRPDSQVIERAGWYQIVTPSAATTSLNEVIYAELSASRADTVIEETVERYRSLNVPFKWVVGLRSAPSDLGRRLEPFCPVRWQAWGMAAAPGDLELAVPARRGWARRA